MMLPLLLPLVSSSCAPRPRLCVSSTECASQNACVAGRCQSEKPNAKPAALSARRLVVRPVDLAYIRRGDGETGGALPPSFSLGRDSAVLLMRFAAALPTNANIIEAYVVLRRDGAVDDEPTPISLHATRIVEGWDGRSTSFARQPRLAQGRAPATLVEPNGPSLVRLDVREIVSNWPKHDPSDQGIAVVAENQSSSGTTFAFRSTGAPAPDVEPYLELYVR